MAPQLEKTNDTVTREPTVEQPDYAVQVDDKLYDARKIASIHPGGDVFVKVFGGKDATEAFLSYHRRRFPHDKMSDALVGLTKPSKDPNSDLEYLELCAEIDKVLPRHKSYAPLKYYLKIGVLLGVAFYLEYYIHSRKRYVWYLTAILGWLFAMIGMNVQHDANHGAISRNPKVNRVLGMSQNWIGGSALDWIHQHVVQHHINPNDIDHDPDIIGNAILRLNPLKPLFAIQHFQHIYIFVLLAVFGLTYIFFTFQHLYEGFHFVHMSQLVKKNRTFEEMTMLVFFFRWFVLPIIQVPALSTMLNVFPMFIVGGYYLAFFFLISHNFEGVAMNEHKFVVEKHSSFMRKQIETASNVGGEWLCFLNGGLNYQIEHHLFPRIQHTHYPLIAPVVKKFCEKKGIPYVHFPTVSENMMSCVRHLYSMGHQMTPKGLQSFSSVKSKTN
jgi:fatty acid desaturase (delta-4 desaturase)